MLSVLTFLNLNMENVIIPKSMYADNIILRNCKNVDRKKSLNLLSSTPLYVCSSNSPRKSIFFYAFVHVLYASLFHQIHTFAHSPQEQDLKISELESENRKMKVELEEFRTEAMHLKNQQATIRRLEERNRLLEQQVSSA